MEAVRRDIVIVYDFPYRLNRYFRIDFILDSARRASKDAEVFSCGPEEQSRLVRSWTIQDSILLRLANFVAYLITFKGFLNAGYLLAMSRELSRGEPKTIIFHSYWTGLYLAFLKKLRRVQTRLVWDWYDLRTRMHFFNRRMTMVGRLHLWIEERYVPRLVDGFIVPTNFSKGLLESWGHESSKIHVLGEIRELNPFVNLTTVKRRIREAKNGAPILAVWHGAIRPYQREGLLKLLAALALKTPGSRRMILNIIGPPESDLSALVALKGRMPSNIALVIHGPLSQADLDRVLGSSHVGIHPLPKELFCRYINSRKMADYLAASLPVAYSSVEGLSETGRKIGVPFDPEDPTSILSGLEQLSDPDTYGQYAECAWETAHQELSEEALRAKGRDLAKFLLAGADR